MWSELLKFLTVTFLYSTPACFVYIRFGMAFWGMPEAKNTRSLLFFALGQSILANFGMIFKSPPSVQFVQFIASLVVMLLICFRKTKISLLFKTALVTYVGYNFSEMLTVGILLSFMDREQILRYPYLMIIGCLPIFIACYRVSSVWIKNDTDLGHKLFGFIKGRKKSPLFWLFTLVSIQAALLFLILVTGTTLEGENVFTNVSYLTVISFTTIGVCLMAIKAVAEAKSQAIQMTQDHYIQEIESMFTVVRGQRHDFLNHVQVIHSMVKMNKNKELLEYAEELLGDIQEINEIIAVGNPAIAAFLKAKSSQSIGLHVKFEYAIQSLKNTKLSINSIDLVRVLGNLVDNAFDAVQHLPPEQRLVILEGCREGDNFRFTVRNSGHAVSQDELRNMLKIGYTTKDSNHSGLGLSIVQELLKKCKGKLEINSIPDQGMEFSVLIPIL
ncbi:sensor histidine kinase [Paenibacillus thermoaerophilus]|uniref:histidine kinase n=1 Tax=Paenibacillus thermoaerophilus TaxID=1215385 RepID=A0ABW2UYV4_9BACL|nr:ATP-binding protein [Paenibacillus thermoaerophilus]TMV16022.1 GHKL domain-containing protein [Paenibacillus thermoaerophilus]